MKLIPIEIPGYNHYLISDTGVVYSTMNTLYTKPLPQPKERKSWSNKKNKYLQVMLQNGKLGLKPKLFYVHRLVAQHFIPNPDNFPEVNHKDFDKWNNNLNNLEWVTQLENMTHYRKTYVTKSNRILENKELLQKGLDLYKENLDIRVVSKLFKVSHILSYQILKKVGIIFKVGRRRKLDKLK
jgi:hypothetical protein